MWPWNEANEPFVYSYMYLKQTLKPLKVYFDCHQHLSELSLLISGPPTDNCMHQTYILSVAAFSHWRMLWNDSL